MEIAITPEALKEIAEQLDTGMVCFYHKTSGKIESYPDEISNPGFDEEFWTDVIDKVEENLGDYLRFEPMRSSEAFRIIEAFIDGIPDIPTHNSFIDAVSRKKPFRQFNDLLHDYPELRSQWFAYKLECYIEFVKEQFEEQYIDTDN